MKGGNCFDDRDFGVMILEGSCVADMAIEDENNDHIGYRVLLRWSDCDCSGLWRYFGWGDKFGSGRIGGRRMEFVVDSRFGGTGIGIRELVGRSVG